MTHIDEMIARLKGAEERLKEVAQGRVYNVGTQVLLGGKYGVVVDLNQGSEDPAGATVDVRLADGTVREGVSVTSAALQKFRG
jgi:hypothetical protein